MMLLCDAPRRIGPFEGPKKGTEQDNQTHKGKRKEKNMHANSSVDLAPAARVTFPNYQEELWKDNFCVTYIISPK